jgi:hypothetical protein
VIKNYLPVLLLLFTIPAAAQNLTGEWKGTLNQSNSSSYEITIEITDINGNLRGTVKCRNSRRDSLVAEFTGKFTNDLMAIKEAKVINCTWPGDLSWTWCLKKMSGTIEAGYTKQTQVIKGQWQSYRHYDRELRYITDLACGSGDFTIKRDIAKQPDTVAKQAPVVLPNAIAAAPIVEAVKLPTVKIQEPSVTDTAKKKGILLAKPFYRPLDGYYKKTNILSAKVTPYANLREADVVFQKRIWQEIDVREKMNQYMASPKSRLIDVLMDAINAGELTAYDPTPTKDDPGGDKFSKPLTPGEAKAKMADSSLVTKRDSANNVISSKMVVGEFDADSIVRFRIKEDWLFDKQRSVYEPRIIGIAPLVKPKAVAGVELDLHLHSGSTSPRRARYWLPKRWLTAITMLQA